MLNISTIPHLIQFRISYYGNRGVGCRPCFTATRLASLPRRLPPHHVAASSLHFLAPFLFEPTEVQVSIALRQFGGFGTNRKLGREETERRYFSSFYRRLCLGGQGCEVGNGSADEVRPTGVVSRGGVKKRVKECIQQKKLELHHV